MSLNVDLHQALNSSVKLYVTSGFSIMLLRCQDQLLAGKCMCSALWNNVEKLSAQLGILLISQMDTEAHILPPF